MSLGVSLGGRKGGMKESEGGKESEEGRRTRREGELGGKKRGMESCECWIQKQRAFRARGTIGFLWLA